MNYRRLGSSDLEVSEISLGSWLTYGGGVERQQAEACVAKAFELGINFIDTANVYGGGAAEEFLGEALAGRPRDSYILATKLYFPMPNGVRFMLDTEETITSFRPDWTRATGNQIGIAFECASAAEVDEIYGRLVDAGFHGEKEPWDAFWGQRYAQLADPDGTPVDLFAAL